MPVLARPPSQVQANQLEGQSSWSDAYGASFDETFATGPLAGIDTALELNASEGGIASYGDAGSLTRQRKLSPHVSLADAMQQVKDAGLEGQVPLGYPQGLRQETLTNLIEKNKARIRRQTLASQYDGWTPQVAGMLAGSIVDPANIALSLVPVVGEARYAKLLKDAAGPLGRFGVRAGVGALEGTVGAVVAEPFIYLGQQQWRNDYDAYDSMLNIVGGATFGAVLHAGAGLAVDKFGRRVGEVEIDRDATLLREAFEVQREVATTGRAPDWMRPLDADRTTIEARLADAAPSARADAPPALYRGTKEGEPGSGTFYTTDRAYAEKYGNNVETLEGFDAEPINLTSALDSEVVDSFNADRLGTILDDALGAELADKVMRALPAGGTDTQISVRQLMSRRPLDVMRDAGVPALKFKQGTGDTVAVLFKSAPMDTADVFAPVRPFIAALDQGTQAASLRMAIGQALQGQKIDVTPAMLSDPMFQTNPSAYAAAREGAVKNTTSMADADQRASQTADAHLRQSPGDTTVEDARTLLADLEERMAQRGLDPKAIEVDDAEIKLQDEGAKVATMCMMRNGA